MTRTLKLTNGSQSVSLIDVSGIIIQRMVDGVQMEASHIYGDQRLIAEAYRLNLLGSSVDNVATQIQTLFGLLNQAMEYWDQSRLTAPVWIEEQLTNESKKRYAIVRDVPMLDWPFQLRNPLELDFIVENYGLTLVREHPWRDTAPGSLPAAAITLTATDGPAGRTIGVVNNIHEANPITHMYNFDSSAGTFSADLAGTDAVDLFPASPAINDRVMFCFASPPALLVLPIGTAGVYTATITPRYSNGAATFADLTLGTNALIYPNTALTAFLKTTGENFVAVVPPSGWVTATYNGQTGYWLALELTAFTSMGTRPATDKASYSQTKPYIEIPSTALVGDGRPLIEFRLMPGSGGGSTPGFGNINRVLIGARSETSPARLSGFYSHLLLGNHNTPSGWGWSVAYDADTSAVAEPLAPGGYKARCTFATDATMKARATLTGTGKLAYNQGRFKVLLACQQIGGSNGDCSVRAAIMIGGSSAGYPVAYIPGSTGVALQSHDAGVEWVDLTGDGFLHIPFGQVSTADSLAADLVVSVLAARSGSAQLDLHQIVLLPVDEFELDLNDPRSDTASGGSSLRGGSLLEVDGGVIQDRINKKLCIGGACIPSENWLRGGNVNLLRPNRQYRFYFVMMNCQGATWYVPPLVGGKGSALAVQLYGVSCFQTLRGNT